MLSSISSVAEFTVVCVPFTSKLPVISTVPTDVPVSNTILLLSGTVIL